MEKVLEKINLPLAIIISAIILGLAFFAVQSNKQKSIERQQFLELQQEKENIENEKETKQKEYVASRKSDCLNIYKEENSKWNNVLDWRYDEANDECVVKYKENENKKTEEQCDSDWPIGGDQGFTWLRLNSLCKESAFEKYF